jgi:hypothetical protein
MHQTPSWEAVEECLRGREARGEPMLILFENAEEISNITLAQVAGPALCPALTCPSQSAPSTAFFGERLLW